ncbi:YkgJ family cysteine cluster protein [Paraburkholderia sp. SOS3]|uniref:YkgJ family cysteine cluster protein n=1 Tax=Paraburkholderia sp. SOS3 TaxID=1926494 RepID=UPI00094734F4|nr:YkgJ family cysteine cluster protein [Paraburkholderia sp. SOS3]APR35044.1 zinc/iron-chelating domain-containing protein [Paraburkholderia sp. SOS3]
MTIHFGCTQCGKCCHNLKLPLSLAEAATWLRRGGDIELFCEAIPWPVEPPDTDAQAMHKRRLSFPVLCGALPIRVVVTVVASFDGACPHLQSDGRCGAYELRPRVCRIYPAEVNPFIPLTPASKACPPEAWSADKPVFLAQERLVDADTLEVINASRLAAAHDAPLKQHLCAYLGVSSAALANEGFVIYAFARDVMLEALERVERLERLGGGDAHALPASEWQFVSNRRATVDALASIEAHHAVASSLTEGHVRYMEFFASDL